MPIYVYSCDCCGQTFERRQSISAAQLVDCPECSGHVHRVIQPVGVVFKGSGFYVTDNRTSSPTADTGKRKSEPGRRRTDPLPLTPKLQVAARAIRPTECKRRSQSARLARLATLIDDGLDRAPDLGFPVVVAQRPPKLPRVSRVTPTRIVAHAFWLCGQPGIPMPGTSPNSRVPGRAAVWCAWSWRQGHDSEFGRERI